MKALSSILLLVLLLVLPACSDGGKAAAHPFDVVQYQPTYATGFRVLGAEGAQSTLMEVFNPWQGAEGVVTRLFISRDGEQPPAGFDGQVLSKPAQRIICLSSTHVAMLDAVGSVSSTVAIACKDFVFNPYIVQHKADIGDIGRDGVIDYELIVALRPDIVLLMALDSASPMEAKLKELRIPYVYIGDYLENSPLGKAEWLVAVAELVGKPDEGRAAFAGIPQRYQALQTMVREAKPSPKPKVMLNTPYRDSWVMAPRSNYVAQLIADAGGDYLYQGDGGVNKSFAIDMEQAYLMAHQADCWINVGQLSTLDELKSQYPKFADVPCVRRAQVYNANKKLNAFGGNDYWESGMMNPDLILRDLISIFHPELLKPDFVYYQQLK